MSAVHPSATQAAHAGGGNARGGEASGARVQGEEFSSSLMGSVRLRGEMERGMAEAMTGDFRDVAQP